jgi:heme/copper-type cytochrome/quinol oxidase subunit 2
MKIIVWLTVIIVIGVLLYFLVDVKDKENNE